MTLGAIHSAALTTSQREAYHQQGYMLRRGLFSTAEIAIVADEAAELFDRRDLIDADNIRCRWQNHVDSGECLFECFDPVIDIGPACGQLANDPRILSILGELYGEPAQLFKDKLIFKPPGARGYNLHQDYIGWENFPRTFVTVLVAIDAARAENGATEVFPACHRQGYLSPHDGMYHDLPLAAVDGASGVILDLEPGDIAIFGCYTPHRSSPNRTSGARRQLYLSYNADSDGGQRRDAHYREFHAWLKDRYAEYGKTHVYFR